MSCPFGGRPAGASRRGFLTAAGGVWAAGAMQAGGGVARRASAQPAARGAIEPYRGPHQGGIATPQQSHVCFAAFDLTATKRDEVAALLRRWSDAADRMTRGEAAGSLSGGGSSVAADGGSALGLDPARLTLTFGFGPGMFGKDGKDRYGLEAKRPAALVELPKFNGDQLEQARCGGDLSVQACADDPQVAFHAVRELDRLAYGTARILWLQNGFLPDTPAGETARNLMGFKDGTNNPAPDGTRGDVPRNLDDVVWVREEGPDWLRGGSYLVVRRIRISLEHWDRTDLDFQEEVIGRHKYSGAPIGKQNELDPLDLDREDTDGAPVIAETAHVRLGAAATNGGAQILRRAYSYNDGVRFTAERWPPWRQGMMYDSGLFFLAYQRDPRTGFIRIFENMAKFDMLNQYTTHNGSALFACPRGVGEGEYVGQGLFES
jgi:deferrochelatase/peroxidase EfeB